MMCVYLVVCVHFNEAIFATTPIIDCGGNDQVYTVHTYNHLDALFFQDICMEHMWNPDLNFAETIVKIELTLEDNWHDC